MKHFKVYGERNTGTAFTGNLLKQNFSIPILPSTVPQWCRVLSRLLYFREKVVDIYFSLTFPKNLGWKHSKAVPERILQSLSINCNGSAEVYFITITKNPYSWLLSMYKNPYHNYKYKKYKQIRDIVKTRWEVNEPFGKFLQSPWPSLGRDNCDLEYFQNLIELWNIKNRSYINLANQGFQYINVRYEDLVVNPEEVLKQISSKFNIEMIGDKFQNYIQSTKNDSKKFQDYQDFYKNEKWKSAYDSELISIVNKYIDEDLLEHFKYEKLEA